MIWAFKKEKFWEGIITWRSWKSLNETGSSLFQYLLPTEFIVDGGYGIEERKIKYLLK